MLVAIASCMEWGNISPYLHSPWFKYLGLNIKKLGIKNMTDVEITDSWFLQINKCNKLVNTHDQDMVKFYYY